MSRKLTLKEFRRSVRHSRLWITYSKRDERPYISTALATIPCPDDWLTLASMVKFSPLERVKTESRMLNDDSLTMKLYKHYEERMNNGYDV